MSQMPYNPYAPFSPAVPGLRQTLPNGTETFLAYMQDGKIFRQAPEGPQQIGVTAKAHDDLQATYDDIYATCQEYYEALVKAGVIVPDPTPEEIMARQAAQLNEATSIIRQSAESQTALAGMIDALRAEIHQLKEKGAAHEPALPAQESAGPVATLEKNGGTGLGDDPGLRKLPLRPDAGDSRKKSEPSGAAKRDALPRKRAAGRSA